MIKAIKIIMGEPVLLIALPISLVSLILMALVRPLVQIRVGYLRSDRIGHFAANTELMICSQGLEINKKKIINLFYLPRKACNIQLITMWRRRLIILPWFLLRPVCLIVRSFDFLKKFRIAEYIGGDRDLDSLLELNAPQLKFSKEEELKGKLFLKSMGINKGTPYVCMIVRDSAYLNQIYGEGGGDYHNHRDSDIQNYCLAAEELAERGYYVIRMGAKVNNPFNSKNPRIIDYACNGMRTDFMDVYLGANCEFCISTSTGFDAVPLIFRRPIVYVNMVPPGWLFTFSKKFLAITKHHISTLDGHELSLKEIFSLGVGYCMDNADYAKNNVRLIENSPEEIRDVVIEMAKRLEGVYQPQLIDAGLQKRFWEIFPVNAVNDVGIRLHGEIRSLYGADFLRQNPQWLN